MKDFIKVLCLGGSFTGRYLSRHFSECRVSFLGRHPGRLEKAGFCLANLHSEKYDFVLDTVPPVMGSRGLSLPYYALLQGHGLLDLPYVHISTTSVLGFSRARAPFMELLPHLDEASEPRPDKKGAVLRYELEGLIRRSFPKSRIVRAAGIYGPGRNLRLSLLRKDTSRMRRPELVVNRIHVEDLCRIILALGRRLCGGADAPAFVIAVDAKAATNAEVYSWLAHEFPEMRALLTEAGLLPSSAFENVCGKVLRSRYTRDLVGDLHFPDYRLGLRHCAFEEASCAEPFPL